MRKPAIIDIEKADKLATSEAESNIAGLVGTCELSLQGVMGEAKSGICCSEFLKTFGTAISGAVVNNDGFPVGKSLKPKTPYIRVYMADAIPHRCYHGKAKHNQDQSTAIKSKFLFVFAARSLTAQKKIDDVPKKELHQIPRRSP